MFIQNKRYPSAKYRKATPSHFLKTDKPVVTNLFRESMCQSKLSEDNTTPPEGNHKYIAANSKTRSMSRDQKL